MRDKHVHLVMLAGWRGIRTGLAAILALVVLQNLASGPVLPVITSPVVVISVPAA